jgi:DNA modification methylase
MTTGSPSIQQVLGRHTVHPFPARMGPTVVLDALASLKRGSRVLDPMVGSGTVAAIARLHGHRAVGFDVDPLATLIARVWTRPIDLKLVRACALKVRERARILARDISTGEAYPRDSDAETREFLRYWFDPYSRRQLAALAISIGSIREDDVREALWCAFSRLIIAKQSGASLALDLAHSRPHRVFDLAPIKPLTCFVEAVERMLRGCIDKRARYRGPMASICIGDARRLPVDSESVDLVFTSPPYLNAIDYLRCSKFSLTWMGYSTIALRTIRSQSIGAEVGDKVTRHANLIRGLRLRAAPSERVMGMLSRYISDTHDALQEIHRVLAPAGRAVYVIGENTIRGTFVPTSKIVVEVANEVGLIPCAKSARNLPNSRRYLPPPGSGLSTFAGRMRREVVLTFSR